MEQKRMEGTGEGFSLVGKTKENFDELSKKFALIVSGAKLNKIKRPKK